MLGFDAFGRLALGQVVESTTSALPVFGGSFALSGEAVTFQIEEVASSGLFSLSGQRATFQDQAPVGFGNFALTGETATFEFFFAETEQFASPRNLLGGAALGEFALGQGAQYLGAFPLTFGYALSGQAVNSTDFEILAGGTFALSGAAYLSWDFLGGGGTIVAGTFSRGRWRALQEELAAEREAEQRKREDERRRRRAARETAAAAERERRQAERARIDAANASAAAERAFADALAVAANVERERAAMQHAAILHALALAAQEKARAQDDEEALALLLAA